MKLLLLIGVPLLAANTTITNSSEPFTDGSGHRLNGGIFINVSQSIFCGSTSVRQPPSVYAPIVNGVFTTSLCPNDVANLANTYYVARITLIGANGGSETKCWTVPSGGPYAPSTIESACSVTSLPVALSRLTSGGAITGNCLSWNGTIYAPGPCLDSFPFTITAQTDLIVAHNLGSTNVDVETYDGSGNLTEAWNGWRVLDANRVEIFWSTPTTGRGVVK